MQTYTHTHRYTHTPTECGKLFHACHCQFLSPRSVQDSLLINMIPLPKIWSLSAAAGRGDVKRIRILTHFTQMHVSYIFLDFSLCWIFFSFGSKWILIQVLSSHTVSKVHLCNSLNESRRACIPVRCLLLDAFPSHWQVSLTVHGKELTSMCMMSSGQRTALSPLPMIQNTAFAISERK